MTKRPQFTLRIAAPLVIGALLLTGCDDSSGKAGESEGPSPTGTADPSPTASTSPTDEPSPTDTPDKPLGPEATIREFVRVHNEMWDDGDTAEFRSMGYRCDYCRKHADTIASIYKNGGYVDSEGWTVKTTKLDRSVGNRRSYWVVLDEAEIKFRERKGGKQQVSKARTRKWLFGLIQRNKEWKVTYGGFDK